MVTMRDVMVEQERRRQQRLLAEQQRAIRQAMPQGAVALKTARARAADWLDRLLQNGQRGTEESRTTSVRRAPAGSGC